MPALALRLPRPFFFFFFFGLLELCDTRQCQRRSLARSVNAQRCETFFPQEKSPTRAPSQPTLDRGGFETIPFFFSFHVAFLCAVDFKSQFSTQNARNDVFQRRGGDGKQKSSPIVTKSPPLFGEHQKTVLSRATTRARRKGEYSGARERESAGGDGDVFFHCMILLFFFFLGGG